MTPSHRLALLQLQVIVAGAKTAELALKFTATCVAVSADASLAFVGGDDKCLHVMKLSTDSIAEDWVGAEHRKPPLSLLLNHSHAAVWQSHSRSHYCYASLHRRCHQLGRLQLGCRHGRCRRRRQ